MKNVFHIIILCTYLVGRSKKFPNRGNLPLSRWLHVRDNTLKTQTTVTIDTEIPQDAGETFSIPYKCMFRVARHSVNHILSQEAEQRTRKASDVMAYVIDTRFAKYFLHCSKHALKPRHSKTPHYHSDRMRQIG